MPTTSPSRPRAGSQEWSALWMARPDNAVALADLLADPRIWHRSSMRDPRVPFALALVETACATAVPITDATDGSAPGDTGTLVRTTGSEHAAPNGTGGRRSDRRDATVVEQDARRRDAAPSSSAETGTRHDARAIAPADAGGDARRCVPLCTSSCADDGCGHPCETCGPGKACVAGNCACDPALPSGWTAFTLYAANPVLVPSRQVALQGSDNVYAPEVRHDGQFYSMWYGAQGGDGHDRIFFASSTDGYTWQKWPSGASPAPVLDVGGSNHVNDPSLVYDGATYRMYYTDADVGINDRVWLATGASPTAFAKVKRVIDVGAAGSWEAVRVGRPSVVFEKGTYRMWYDGFDGAGRHVGYAESTDGETFVKYSGNPVFRNAGAVDVKKVGGVYVMLRESGDGTYFATSVDGLCWVDRGLLFGKSGSAYDAYGQVTPFLFVEHDEATAVYFGGASASTWDKNRIAIAHVTGVVPPASGCTGCVPPGSTCAEACASAGAADYGTCGSPGSQTAGACCACADDGCGACLSKGQTCATACSSAGKSGGYCGNPGSHDPSACCSCF